MLTLSEIIGKKKSIALAVVSGGIVPLEWAFCLRGIAWPMNCGFVELPLVDTAGGEVAEGRNRLVQVALDSCTAEQEISHLFWLDDDVLASKTVVQCLLSHNADIASGVYFSRSKFATPVMFDGPGAGSIPFVPDQVIPVWGHGLGLALIKLDVYRRMQAEIDLGTDKYGLPAWHRNVGPEGMTIKGGMLWQGTTEDLYFCELAHMIGLQPIVDTSIDSFGWHMDRKTRAIYPQQKWRERMETGRITWRTDNGPVVWG